MLRALVGMCYMHDQPGWQTSVLRLVDVFVDGLRIPATAARASTAAARRGVTTKNVKKNLRRPASRKKLP